MSVSITALTAAQLAEYIASFAEYETIAQAIAQGGFYILEDGSLAGTALVPSGGAAIATYSSTGTALELAQASQLLASGSEVGSAAIGLAGTGTGTGYTAMGLTSIELGAAAAACAPLLGVSLGVNLYESNPVLWTKLSEKLLPFCYPGTTQVPSWIDIVRETGAYKLLVKLGLIEALEEQLKELGVIDSNGQYISYEEKMYTNGENTVGVSPTRSITFKASRETSPGYVNTDSPVELWYSGDGIFRAYYPTGHGTGVKRVRFGFNTQRGTGPIYPGETVVKDLRSYGTITDVSVAAYPDTGAAIDAIQNGTSETVEHGTPGVTSWDGTTPEVLPWTQPIIVVPDPVGPDYQPITEPVTPIAPQTLPELPPHVDPLPLPPHVDPSPEPIQPTEPDYPPDGWPDEEPWPEVIPFPWEDPNPDPDDPWPEVMPWPLPEVPPYEWPTAPEWPTEVPIPQPWPRSPEDWPDENPWPESPPEWWPLNPWPKTPEKWPEVMPWPDTAPDSWPEEVPWPNSPDSWPEEIPWPETKPDDWPDTVPWPDDPDDWPDIVPWPAPWPPEWPETEPWPIKWPEELPYPWKFPEPVPSPDSNTDPDPTADPDPEEVQRFIDLSPWPTVERTPYDDPVPPDPERDPSEPDPIPNPRPDVRYTPDPPTPSGESPDATIDPIVDLPFSATTGLITVYNPTQAELLDFCDWLWVTWQDATIDKIWNNPFDGVITLFELYCTPTVIGQKTIRSGFLDSGVTSDYISRYTSINCGSIGIPEYYGNYLDYAPYTKAYIYLPFIGVVELNSDDIVGHAVNVLYHIDEYNGSCIAQITVARSIDVNGSLVDYSNTFYQFSGNCAVELPIAGGSQAAIKAGMLQAAAYGLGSVIGGAINGAAQGGRTGAAQGGRTGALAGGAAGLAYGASNAVSSVVSAKSSVQHSGSFGSSYGAMGIKTPFITIVRPKQIQIPNYEAFYGFPAHKAVIIGQCSGFLRCREVHVHSSTASDEEKALIEQMLKEGVIIGDSE